ncbi:MAG: nucleotide exchange factor GrpE [Fimbriimonadaceae bacterium]|nr:nucleotide exchange factor GrpE [Fimbriimonadaceae bacterium]
MSTADLAAALIGLRESTWRDHQATAAELAQLTAVVQATRAAIDDVLDARLATSAQAFLDVVRRIEETSERRFATLARGLLDVLDRLDSLQAAQPSSDPTELLARLSSLELPREQLRQLLAEQDVEAFTSLGEPYDPRRHEVVERRRDPACSAESVAAELTPGYWQRATGQPLRRARVVLRSPPA